MSYPPNHPNQPLPPVPPGYGPPPVAPKKTNTTKIVLGVVGGVLGLCCFGGIAIAAFGGGSDKPADAAADKVTTQAGAAAATTAPARPVATTAAAPAPVKTTAAKPPAEKAPGLGDPVRDGKFEFTVTKVDCSRTKVGNSFLNEKAQGKFCQISVTVKNIGKKAQLFDGSSQKALDGDGTEYSNDGEAEIYANDDNATFLNEINPGNQAKGKLIFDVPKSTKLTKLELHDSMFSGGVEVALS
ncbi:DUF4352 domain-containing protein [Actinoplanes sp. N902-109]|uniref:DUF4352 domain-containing protein n=1 Tax=Actinoplanes sp. (strain N902-109) TaxID=649831 RepID=UPI0003294361|nr:DUF4352 domain-containing protein [Actinoplanes sp. N902-109]AGL21434.1 hypothetical protein L083_7924 [Actinoplanes sp. N902-109]